MPLDRLTRFNKSHEQRIASHRITQTQTLTDSFWAQRREDRHITIYVNLFFVSYLRKLFVFLVGSETSELDGVQPIYTNTNFHLTRRPLGLLTLYKNIWFVIVLWFSLSINMIWSLSQFHLELLTISSSTIHFRSTIYVRSSWFFSKQRNYFSFSVKRSFFDVIGWFLQ